MDHILQCLGSGKELEDDGLILGSGYHEPAFLRAQYSNRKFSIDTNAPGLYRFRQWLPIQRILKGSSAPITYKSTGLADYLGLTNLYITFNGYWPEKGVEMVTGTFKECEAYSVCARMPLDTGKVLVVASAGNTARAFARVCSENNIPLLLCVPENNLSALWFDTPVNPCVKLIAAGGDSDYFDAITLSQLATSHSSCFPEGGAKNVARRDGMGCTVLSAVTEIGSIPDYYFQAVGSGTGAIAAWEAVQRFAADGQFGTNNMKLMLSQNAPFLLLADSWSSGSRQLAVLEEGEARKQVEIIDAKVLSNRKPPFTPVGGLFDALSASGGAFYGPDNGEAREAGALFLSREGNDIAPAAAVAAASLIQAIERRDVEKDAVIMLNITGGGMERFKRERDISLMKPDAVVQRKDMNEQYVHSLIDSLLIKEN